MSAGPRMNAADLSPADFLREVLRPAPKNAVGWVTIFKPPPTAKAPWGGHACTPDALPSINGANAYFSVAAFAPDTTARKIGAMLGTGVVLCDDIGQKAEAVDVVRLFGEPSYKIQTSPRSQQWGYLLDALAAAEEIKPIHEGLKGLRLTDQNGLSAVRYGRLPAGVNNKPEYGEAFAVRCLEWNPERRFSLAQIATALPRGAPTPAHRPTTADPESVEGLAEAIMSGESYHGPLMKLAAKYAYMNYRPGDVVMMLKGAMFSSEDRSERWKDRADDIERTVKTAFDKFAKPDIEESFQIREGSLREATLFSIGVLQRRGIAASIFSRSDMLVRPYLVERVGFHEQPVLSLEMAQLTPPALVHELGGLIQFFKIQKTDAKLVRANPPAAVANTILAVPYEWGSIPRLDVLVSVPLYLGVGRLLAEPGYHAARRAWLTVPAGVACKERPTRAGALAALSRLDAWFDEFPFLGDVDRSVMLAAAISAALRPSLDFCPGFAFDAPVYGVGKTTAAEAVHVIGFGRVPAVMQFLANYEETRKQLDSAQIAGRQSLTYDNVPTGLIFSGDGIAQVLSQREREARELGESKIHVVPCNQFLMVTGNNLTIGQDLTRRTLSCRFDPREDPTSRTFQRPRLLAELMENRVAILSDIFTMVAAYEAAGEVEKPPPLVGYERWCRWVQRPLVWLGRADPLLSLRALQGDDPEQLSLDDVVERWNETFGSEWVTVKQLITYSTRPGHRDLIDALEGIEKIRRSRDGGLDAAGVGRWLDGVKGRWSRARVRVERADRSADSKSARRWRVAGVSGVCRGLAGPVARDFPKTNTASSPETPVDPLDPCSVEDPGDEM